MFAPGGPSRATVTGTDRGPSDRETARIRQPQAGALLPLSLRLGSGFPGPAARLATVPIGAGDRPAGRCQCHSG